MFLKYVRLYGIKIILLCNSFFPAAFDGNNGCRESMSKRLLDIHKLNHALSGTGVICNCLHPGAVKSSLANHAKDGGHLPFIQRILVKVIMPIAEATVYISSQQGAQTSIYCSVAPELEGVSGKYIK